MQISKTSSEKQEKNISAVPLAEKNLLILPYFKIINCLQLSDLPLPHPLSSLWFFTNLSSAFNVIFCTIRANFHGSIMWLETTSIARFFYPISLSTPQLWWKEKKNHKTHLDLISNFLSLICVFKTCISFFKVWVLLIYRKNGVPLEKSLSK